MSGADKNVAFFDENRAVRRRGVVEDMQGRGDQIPRMVQILIFRGNPKQVGTSTVVDSEGTKPNIETFETTPIAHSLIMNALPYPSIFV